MERILQTLERLGASVGGGAEAIELAWPTSSVIEREAVETLTRAKTDRAVRFLAWQRENLPAELEAVAWLCRSDPAAARLRLSVMADGFPVARRLVEGVTVALVGPPNSGKSTLFNRLIGRPATVVSPLPGTTRDWVAEEVEMDGVPVTLVDTAGRRESDDSLEQQAVAAGRQVVERAEVCLLLLDGSQPLSRAGQELLAASRTWDGCVMVITKSDAGAVWEQPTSGWPASLECVLKPRFRGSARAEARGPSGFWDAHLEVGDTNLSNGSGELSSPTASGGAPITGGQAASGTRRSGARPSGTRSSGTRFSGTRRCGTRRMVSVSGLTGAGCDRLVSAMMEVLGFRGWVESVPCLFTRRQVEAAADILSVLRRDPMSAKQRLERCLIGRCGEVTKTGGGL